MDSFQRETQTSFILSTPSTNPFNNNRAARTHSDYDHKNDATDNVDIIEETIITNI